MAKAEEPYLSAYLFAVGTTESTLSYAQSLVEVEESGVHFVFPLVGAWDSMTVLQAAPGDLNAIRALVTDLTDGRGDGDRVPNFSVAIPLSLGRIKKRPARPYEALVAIRTSAGVAGALFDDLQADLDSPDIAVVERVNGGYDLVCELGGPDLESTQGAVEDLRTVVGDRATVDVAYAAF